MKLNSGLAKRLFLFITPLVTSSVFTTAASQAATLARADAFVDILKFSQNPESTSASSVNSITGSRSVISQANADAFFFNKPALVLTESSLEAFGDEPGHFGGVRSKATVVGNFFIDAEPNYPQSFSFKFDAFLNLETLIDSSRRETASAATDIYLFLVDRTDNDNHKLLDFFSISSKLATTGEDKLPSFQMSNNFTLVQFFSFVEVGADLQDEFADVQALGSYRRDFDRPTSLSLVGAKQTEVAVESEAQVPEPSSTLALFSLGGLISTWLAIKHKE